MSAIFVSYRRDDSSGHAGRICDRLAAYFGEERVFIDVDGIEPGRNFQEVIDASLASCEVMLVVIGKSWLTASDDQRRKRLLDRDDFVRREVLAGMERGIALIPVLVGGALMPFSADLPSELADLASKQALDIADKRFHRDVDQLISVVEQKLREAEGRKQREAAERQRLERSDVVRRRTRMEVILLLVPSFGFASAYYVVGPTLRLTGPTAPWLILIILLFSCALRTLHLEGHGLFGKEEIYKTVRTALGPSVATLTSAALLFDYLLIGPICVITAGVYILEAIDQFLIEAHIHPLPISTSLFAQVIGVLIVIHYWRKQIKRATAKTRSLAGFFKMVFAAVLLGWSGWSCDIRGVRLPPGVDFKDFLPQGRFEWLQGIASHPSYAILIGLSLSMLALTPSRNIAEVRRFVASTEIRRLKWAAWAIWTTDFLFPFTIPFGVVMLIPHAELAAVYLEWPVGSLALYEVGPLNLRLAFEVIVVIVGGVSLWKAMGRMFARSTLLLVEMTEDQGLPRWLLSRKDQYQIRFSFTHVVAVVLLLLLILTGGSIQLLTEMYAFGMVWGFLAQAISLLILRRRLGNSSGWRVPLNIRIAGFKFPAGLLALTGALIALASIGVVVRPKAAIAGTAFALTCFLLLRFGTNPKDGSARLPS